MMPMSTIANPRRSEGQAPLIVGCPHLISGRFEETLRSDSEGASWLRVEAKGPGSGLNEPPASWFLDRFPGQLIYARRLDLDQPIGHDPARGDRLIQASETFDLVELDADVDLKPEILDAIPPDQRLISWQGRSSESKGYRVELRRITSVPSRFYRMVVDPDNIRGVLSLLQILKDARRDDLIAFADGPDGLWSRVLATHLGSPLFFENLRPSEGVIGDRSSLSRVIEDYGLQSPTRVDRLCAIVGDPVRQSPSPRLHNAGYRALNLPNLFVPIPIHDFDDFWRDLVEDGPFDRLGFPLEGLTVASPFKDRPISVASASTRSTRLARSSNLMYRRQRRWIADTTDPEGVIGSLASRQIVVKGRRAAVIGCGGSGRAIASALDRSGARVVLVNRGRLRGELVASQLGLPWIPLTRFEATDFDLIVNATPVGRTSGESPIQVDHLGPASIIVDLVYSDQETALVSQCRARGAQVIDGHEVLQVQVRRQFRRMTGRSLPEVRPLRDQSEDVP